MARYTDKFSRSPRRNQIERVGRMRDLPRVRQVRRRPNQPVMQPLYSRFGANDIVDSGDTDTVTSALWSNQDGVLASNELYTGSIQSQSSGEYYLDIYRETLASNSDREVQMSIGYGHFKGSGSQVPQYATEGFTPTKAIHSQYANLLLAPGDDQFSLANRSGSLANNLVQFHFINVQRSRLKERLDPGNWELHIAGFSGSNVGSAGSTFVQQAAPYTAVGLGGSLIIPSHSTIKLIDDSTVSDGTIAEAGTVYKIVSGTIANGPAVTSGTPTEYGLFYPDNGMFILDTEGIDGHIGMRINSSSHAYCSTPVTLSNANTTAFYSHLVGGQYFAARNKETVHATHYFIRVRNQDYNFSNNPTFTSGSQGTFTHPSFFKDPKVYITTVGMYNDQNELLAVAKMSKPLLKSYNREALIRVKLEY
tara:strand:+ start:3208 stop:4470 length:1263 start_codon:yes stop_codon:yes gene_type:complete